MKKGPYKYLFLTGIALLIFSCSVKKNSFKNRTYHEMTAKYNILYNGNLAFDDAKKQLDDSYEDNFWERLPIEPLKISEDIPMPGQSATQSPIEKGFEKAEEKAVKAIQKHSMLIDGYEHNNQIDDAYFLLGKSRYYMQRFIPALEAFTYAIEKYPNANLYYDTKIWKAKTNIRLQNEMLAIETLKIISRQFELPEEILEQAHTALAMAYTQLDSTQQVIDHLKQATYYFKDPVQSSRNMFILGQIYREENKIDSSNMAFESLLYLKKVPHKYKVHAQIERAKNYRAQDSTQALIFALRKLAEERENLPYYDELYYQAGLIALQKNKIDDARFFFEQSVRFNQKKPYQKSLSYEQLGNLYYNLSEYATAGAYYDSVLQVRSIDHNSKRIRRIIRKNAGLSEVVKYERILHTNDSILYIAGLPPEEQKAYFEEYVSHLKQIEEAEKALEEQQNYTAGFGKMNAGTAGQNNAEGKFYFYNVQIVGFGIQEFKKQFGNRPLRDNWIFSDQQMAGQDKSNEPKTEVVQEDRYQIDTYLKSIPKDPKVLDSIRNVRNDAYYNLGLIYKEQFKDYEKAAENFENYLKSGPNPNLVLPVKYQLFRTYENFNTELSNKYKDEIVKNYPESRFAQMILNPQKKVENDDIYNSPEFIYKGAFVCYEEGDYDYAMSSLNSITHYEGLDIEPKIELLKAYITLKSKGMEAGKKLLEQIVINYPNTEESKNAKKAIDKINELKKQKK